MALVHLTRSTPRVTSVLVQSTRSKGYWNHEWQPSLKIPKTEEEKAAAAKKYGLIPADYKPYPHETGEGYGDYPMLEIMSQESRNQHEPVDELALFRNYGEPLHVSCDMYGADRLDYNKRYRFSALLKLSHFLGFLGIGFILFWLSDGTKVTAVKRMARHVPDGTPRYSFELESVE